MDGIRIYIRTREGTVQETAFEQSGNTCSFSLSGITDRQLFLELVFREVTAVMGLSLKDRFGTACLCLVENGFSAGDAMLSEDRSVRIRVIRPENCDGEVLNGTFTAVEMPGGRELVRSVGERLSKQETQIRECEEKISALAERVKNERYAREALQKEAVWKTCMETLSENRSGRERVSGILKRAGKGVRRLLKGTK